jgi:hypothetical protein
MEHGTVDNVSGLGAPDRLDRAEEQHDDGSVALSMSSTSAIDRPAARSSSDSGVHA